MKLDFRLRGNDEYFFRRIVASNLRMHSPGHMGTWYNALAQPELRRKVTIFQERLQPPTMPETRASLISRIKSLEDAPSWEEFDRLYRPLLIRYASERGLAPDESEEIAQQCMAAIAGGIQNFQRKISFRGWLRGMVDHKVADQLKKRNRESNAKTADLQSEQQREDSPALLWERQWNQTHLLYCLNCIRDEITPLTYEAFHAYVIEELPLATIGERLGMTSNQIYVAKHRVIARLKKQWAQLADGLV